MAIWTDYQRLNSGLLRMISVVLLLF